MLLFQIAIFLSFLNHLVLCVKHTFMSFCHFQPFDSNSDTISYCFQQGGLWTLNNVLHNFKRAESPNLQTQKSLGRNFCGTDIRRNNAHLWPFGNMFPNCCPEWCIFNSFICVDCVLLECKCLTHLQIFTTLAQCKENVQCEFLG